MFANILFQICGFETLDTGGWMNINVLVVLLSITAAALVYALSSLLPSGKREALRGVSSYEMLEAMLSLALVFVLILFSSFACNAGAALVGSQGYTSLFSSVENYLGSLLFVNGLNLISKFFTTSIQLGLISNVVQAFLGPAAGAVAGVGSALAGGILPGWITFGVSPSMETLFLEYSGLYDWYIGLLFASFGTLFIPLVLLPIIEAGALTVMAPVAIVTRALSFFGPQFRKVSNMFIAIAMGFYFVFPLTLALDAYVAGCLGIGLGIQAQASCSSYPFSSYLKGYSLPQITSSIFTSVATPSQLSSSVVPSWLSGAFLPFTLPISLYGSAANFNLILLLNAPQVAATDGQTVAAYLFLSVVLLAIDMAITAGFIQGVAKGLDAISDWFGVRGGFWGA